MTSGVLIGAPVAGQLVDRYGARRVLLPSIVALGLGTIGFSMMTADPRVFYLIFFVTAVLGSATLPITWTKAIVNNFDRHRGLALGIALTGTGLYGFVASPLHPSDDQRIWLALGLYRCGDAATRALTAACFHTLQG